MNESIKALLELLLKDETAAKKVLDCESKAEAYAQAVELVGGYTREEFEESMAVLAGIAERKESGELADAELDGVAGGYDENTLGPTESDSFRRAKQQLASAGRAKAEADAIINQIKALQSLSPQEYAARRDEANCLMVRVQECMSIYNSYLMGAHI